MKNFARLNFPACRLRLSSDKDNPMVWDPLRKSYLRLTPEEWVRQHLIRWLTDHCKIHAENIVQEYPVAMNGLSLRADVVVIDRQGKPLLLVECKAWEVAIDDSVLDQVVRYNHVVGAQAVMITNGMSHFFFRAQAGGGYTQLKSLPDFSEYQK